MYVQFSELSTTAKSWIYQADRKMTTNELTEINQRLLSFCNSWSAHKRPLKSSFQLHNWFICLFVDEETQSASGCSIDNSVELIKTISRDYNIDFFNRMNIAFKENDIVKVLHLDLFKQHMNKDMTIFNNLVSTKSEYENNWLIPLKTSWLARYL